MVVFLIVVIAIVGFIVLGIIGENDNRKKLGIPKIGRKINYFKGYDKKIGGFSSKLYYWNQNNTLYFCDTDKKSGPARITIPKENIIAFSILGDITSNTVVKGGGVSLGGAALGGVLLGPLGAVIGSRKKVKSQNVTSDTRQTVLKFLEDNIEKSMLIEYSIYSDLCLLCVEKKAG